MNLKIYVNIFREPFIEVVVVVKTVVNFEISSEIVL